MKEERERARARSYLSIYLHQWNRKESEHAPGQENQQPRLASPQHAARRSTYNESEQVSKHVTSR